MLPIINQWNRWGQADLKSGHRRDILEDIIPFLDTPEVVALVGLRRAGKTTLLYQIMDLLEAQGIAPEAMLHMNFEEPALATQWDLPLLDTIYRTYREEIYPTGKAYIFFDEIQNVPEWERWVRARNENESIKIFITGSSAHLMSRELATVLTGRHVEFFISSLSFSEYLHFQQIKIPKKRLPIDASPEIQKALKDYMTWGGLPEVVLSKHVQRKRLLLIQYFDDILFKDVAMRHQIRDVTVLRNIAVHLITQTACLFSINRIAKIFGISLEMAANYCSFLQEAFLVDFIPYFTLKTAERQRNPQKIHVSDVGFRQIVTMSMSPDYGKLAETLVYQHLQRQHRHHVFYWKDKQEIDFVIRDGNDISLIIQVCYAGLDDSATRTREISSLEKAQSRFNNAKSILITHKQPKLRDKRILLLWNVLLHHFS